MPLRLKALVRSGLFQSYLSKKNLFTLFIVISGNFPLHAQVRPKISDAAITVEFTNPVLAKRPLTLQTVKDNVFSYIGGEEHTKYADQDGCYRFRLKDVSNAIPVKIAVKCKESLVFGLIENYIEPGDSIHIRFTGKSVLGSKSEDIEFTGIGTAKFIVKNKLKNLTANNLVRPAGSIPVDTKYLDALSGMADSTYIFFKRILDSYKDDIHKNIFQILDAEIYGKAHGSIFNHLAEFYNLHPGLAPEFKDSILSYLPGLQKKTYKDYSPMSLQASGYLN